MRRTRREILRDSGLLIAPAEVQKFFWRRYNAGNRRLPALLSDVAARVVLGRQPDALDDLDRLTQAWKATLPIQFGAKTRIEGLSGGCLRLRVDCAATKYVLTRQLAGDLIAALNATLGSTKVRKLDCRIGRLEASKRTRETRA